MPLFELRDGHLRALRRLHPGPDLYEAEIEQLVWDDLEAFLGEPLFPVARQARLPSRTGRRYSPPRSHWCSCPRCTPA